jgi:hypothetical protein
MRGFPRLMSSLEQLGDADGDRLTFDKKSKEESLSMSSTSRRIRRRLMPRRTPTRWRRSSNHRCALFPCDLFCEVSRSLSTLRVDHVSLGVTPCRPLQGFDETGAAAVDRDDPAVTVTRWQTPAGVQGQGCPCCWPLLLQAAPS